MPQWPNTGGKIMSLFLGSNGNHTHRRWRDAFFPSLVGSKRDDTLRWLRLTIEAMDSATASTEFLQKALSAFVQIATLRSATVLLLDGDSWKIAASHGTSPVGDWQPSRPLMARLWRKRKPIWWSPDRTLEGGLPGLCKVLAAPVFNTAGNMIGMLYGERFGADRKCSLGPGILESLLVEMLASAVSSGLALRQQQSEVQKARVRFEEFFTPQLAQQLYRDPDLLQGREAEVTLLFCDIRGFSRISERIGPAATVRWIGDVMGELSQCVLEQEGVLVDYIGDELIAMWGAPQPQTDQASRAVAAALAMRIAVHELDDRWRRELGEPLEVGIGLNTGPAQVGNMGSTYKFKYGPLGNTVNLASRVQGLTKHVRCRLLVTAATRAQLDSRFISRRVCQSRVVNIVEPVVVYEVDLASRPGRAEFFDQSEEALDHLEAGKFAQAARLAGTLLLEHRGDGPLLLVLSRAAEMLMQGGEFDPVWEPKLK
jgi:adenylate cyclase